MVPKSPRVLGLSKQRVQSVFEVALYQHAFSMISRNNMWSFNYGLSGNLQKPLAEASGRFLNFSINKKKIEKKIYRLDGLKWRFGSGQFLWPIPRNRPFVSGIGHFLVHYVH